MCMTMYRKRLFISACSEALRGFSFQNKKHKILLNVTCHLKFITLGGLLPTIVYILITTYKFNSNTF
jgi:hypothetical protein